MRRIIFAIIGIVIVIAVFLIVRNLFLAPQPFLSFSSMPAQSELLTDGTDVSLRKSAAAPQEIPAEKEYPKRVAVSLRSWSDIEAAKKIITDSGGQILKALDWPSGNVIIAIFPDGNSERKILKNSFWGKIVGGIGFSKLGNRISGGIDSAEEDIKAYPQEQAIPWGVSRIKADKVWNAAGGATGKGVKVAIIDSGIQYDHPDLKDNIGGGINIATGGALPADWNDDCVQSDGNLGHGTAMAGDVAAMNNNFGIIGVAPEASLYAVKVSGKDCAASMSDLISGIYWAANNGMQVANMSLGQFLYNSPFWMQKEKEAVDYAYQRGVVLVASAGNLAGQGVTHPAAFESVIAVGATIPDDRIASFSSYGPEVELSAPGLGILTTIPGGAYDVRSGTSESAPYAAGVAALILEKNPQFTPAQVRELLRSTAIDLGSAGKDDYFGYGLVNAKDSLIFHLPVAITLDSPKGGERWPQGIKQDIIWRADNLSSDEKVDIRLIHQYGGNLEAIPVALDAFNSGKISWNVPLGLPAGVGDSYYLQISCGRDFIGKCDPAKSGLLDIVAPLPQALKVISPNGGEKWPQGTIQSILWSANYLGGPEILVSLMGKKSVPQYSLSFARDDAQGVKTISEFWNVLGRACCWGVFEPPAVIDTCDGNRNSIPKGGNFACPKTSATGEELRCLDVVESRSTAGLYFGGNVVCQYQQSGTIDTIAPVKTLAQNVLNNGSLEISVPDDLLGNDYFLQLTCSDFTGECAKGLSAAPFSIVKLSDPVSLSINKSGIGAVTDGSFICPADRENCLQKYEKGEPVKLSPVASIIDPTLVFTGWSGACEGAGPCEIAMDGDKSVTATFSSRSVTLTAIADPGSIFTGWSGDCIARKECSVSWSSDCPTDAPCHITVTDDQRVNANFVKSPELKVTKAGTGAGRVSGKSIDCGATCSATYPVGSSETLSAFPDSSSIFSGWSGACSGTGTCNLLMDADKSVTATFNAVCSADTWTCGPWTPEACPLGGGTQTRTCEKTFDCADADTPPPPASQTCESEFTPGPIKEVRPE